MSTDLPDDRCGYQSVQLPRWDRWAFVDDEKWDQEDGVVTCLRESWKNHDRCIWHTEIEDKPADDLVAARDDGPERLVGAYLVNADCGDRLSFSRCHLWEANLAEINFQSADLSEADLMSAHLPEANLADTDLSEAKLLNADLPGANLSYADLPEADLGFTDLSGVNFFGTDLSGAYLQYALCIRTDLRETSLVDTELFDTMFANVRLSSGTEFGDRCRYDKAELDIAIDEKNRYSAAAWTYRRLETLHEENALSERARHYHIRKQEAHRKDHGRQFWQAFDDREPWTALSAGQRWIVSSLNFALTEHGENLRRLVSWAIGIIIVAGFLYPFVGGFKADSTNDVYRLQLGIPTSLADVLGAIPTLLHSWYFSIITFTTIGYGDLYPTGVGSKILVGFESLAGGLLIALFVYVLGRRVAR